MKTIAVDTMTFSFPDDWKVTKYDDWAYYQKSFKKIQGTNAVDLIAIDPERTVWLIEVKDYSIHPRKKTQDICLEMVDKTLGTLAAMLPAKVGADDTNERDLAMTILRATKLRVVLHLEQTSKPSKLYPRVLDSANTKQKLRGLIKPIDPHPFVAEMSAMGNLRWTVSRLATT